MTTQGTAGRLGRRILQAAVTSLAALILVDLVLGAMSARWQAGDLWLAGGALPVPLVRILAALFALGHLVVVPLQRRAAGAVRGLGLLLAVACLADAIVYYRLLGVGRITTRLPVPLSLLLGTLLLLWGMTRTPAPRARRSRSRRATWVRVLDRTAPVWFLGLGLLLHVVTFGATDYRRPADAAVVFGAAGVPAEALVLDEQGITTDASLRNVRRLARAHGWRRLLMVSHDYHLAPISMAARRAGLQAVTVPAREPRALGPKPWFVLRELAAFVLYYARS